MSSHVRHASFYDTEIRKRPIEVVDALIRDPRADKFESTESR